MNLTDMQKQLIAKWVAEGAKLSDIQKRINSELGMSLTYMEVRLLVDDLKLVPKDPAPAVSPERAVLGSAGPTKPGSAPPTPTRPAPAEPVAEDLEPIPGGVPGNVSVTVDTIARPGAMVSGSVRFGDGQTATWYLDQMGRLGLAPKQQGYRPGAADLQAFQQALENELSKMGF